MYTYEAKIVRVIDGDTIEVMVDVGFNIHHKITLRLLGINAPEMKGKTRYLGQMAKEYLFVQLSLGTITVQTYKDKKEKYGRYLATVLVNGENINQKMIDSGNAVIANY